MKKVIGSYIKEAAFYLAATTVFFALILLILHYTTNTPVSPLEVVSSLLGISYILTIRNPNNYVGFYVGIVSSVLLAMHFFEIKEYPSAVLYLGVYVPCQILTIINWVRGQKAVKENAGFAPSFLSKKGLGFMLGLLVVVSVVTYGIFSWLRPSFWVVLLLNAVFVGLNVLANILVIMKKTECFFFWVLSCILGAIIFTLAGSYFTVLLYCVFITVNALGLINWTVATPAVNYGWMKK